MASNWVDITKECSTKFVHDTVGGVALAIYHGEQVVNCLGLNGWEPGLSGYRFSPTGLGYFIIEKEETLPNFGVQRTELQLIR